MRKRRGRIFRRLGIMLAFRVLQILDPADATYSAVMNARERRAGADVFTAGWKWQSQRARALEPDAHSADPAAHGTQGSGGAAAAAGGGDAGGGRQVPNIGEGTGVTPALQSTDSASALLRATPGEARRAMLAPVATPASGSPRLNSVNTVYLPDTPLGGPLAGAGAGAGAAAVGSAVVVVAAAATAAAAAACCCCINCCRGVMLPSEVAPKSTHESAEVSDGDFSA